jgi:hypothetical protein
MKDIIRDLVINGTDPQEIRAVLDKFEAEMAETAALAKEQEKEEARMILVDALAKYYIAAGIMTEEEVKTVDWNYVMNAVLNMEQNLLKFKKALTDNRPAIKVKVSEAPKEGRNLTFEDWLEELENMFK